jgi:D-glycero-alpha-D-manno-heptose-7-phosphate kinase
VIKDYQSPTRADLVGGTLDMWPLSKFVRGQSYTINIAISVFTKVKIRKNTNLEINWHSFDLNEKFNFKDISELSKNQDPRVFLIQSVIEYLKWDQGVYIETSSQSPVGGGLGGSSSMMITLLKAFGDLLPHEKMNLIPGSKNSVKNAELAHNLEAQLLRTPTGTQDYYAPMNGGLNIIEQTAMGERHELHPIPDLLKTHLMVIYSGHSHHSGLNNFDILRGSVEGDQQILNALQKIRDLSEETYLNFKEGNFDWPKLFREEMRNRVLLSSKVISPKIEELEKIVLASGAEALKICGAGGGGCVLVWCPPNRQAKVAETCQKAGFKILPATPVDPI